DSYEQAVIEGTMELGRKGFFLNLQSDFPREGEIVGFHWHFKNSIHLPEKLSGYGKVIWVRKKSDKNKQPGIGVLIQHVDSSGLQLFVDWLVKKNFIAVIPNGLKE
ncbi:MAG: hypothetical protein KDD40_04720, partial [Bdellovibrionales bacterium]|nr:hypothetical protein [Bdellovibrionales bacterium]